MCLWNTITPAESKSKSSYFKHEGHVKVTRSLTLVSFERTSLVEHASKLSSLHLLRFKTYSKSYMTLTTDTDKTSTICPIILILGQKKSVMVVKYNPHTFDSKRDHLGSASLWIHHNTRITSEIRRLNIADHQTTGRRGNSGHQRCPDIVLSVCGD